MPWKFFWEKIRGRADLRSALNNGARSFLVMLITGLAIKLFILDSVKINGVQMEPAVQSGDRLLFLKNPYVTPVVRNYIIRPEMPVAAVIPYKGVNTILRIAALPGDSVNIYEGLFYRNGATVKRFERNEPFSIIPAEYSPVDFMAPFKIPAPGDYVDFGKLTQRDLIFAYSILRQEKSNVRLKASVIEGDSVHNEYEIMDFTLYGGRIDSIPERLHTDWFFWDRLQGYLSITATDDNEPKLAFSVFRGKNEIGGFKVSKRYVFLMGDNWSGALDSRYFGPVAVANITGRPFITLWGFTADGKKIDSKRFFRIIE